MFQQVESIGPSVVAIRIEKSIEGREARQIEAFLHDKIASAGKIALLLVVKQYRSFDSAEDLYMDLGFFKRFEDHLERLAVVGEALWRRTWVGLFGLFSGIETAYFTTDQFAEALAWVSGR